MSLIAFPPPPPHYVNLSVQIEYPSCCASSSQKSSSQESLFKKPDQTPSVFAELYEAEKYAVMVCVYPPPHT